MGQRFGGGWTEEKLIRLRKYLVAYTKIMKNTKFRYAYIDAFAGTGYRTLREEENPNQLLLPELVEQESQEFLDGSARIALKIDPPFQTYVFIEKDERRFWELEELKRSYPLMDIHLENAEANAYITTLCRERNWKHHRAVLFLDPFGMQVNWSTIEAIASTQAIDLWYLFPLGVAVNRVLRKDGQINQVIKQRLDILFGDDGWYDEFYRTDVQWGLFGEEYVISKAANFESIGRYLVSRLRSIFPEVADNPLRLENSKNVPLYLLCFASANATGRKIAQAILSKK